jgi:RHS repeat-associated protein
MRTILVALLALVIFHPTNTRAQSCPVVIQAGSYDCSTYLPGPWTTYQEAFAAEWPTCPWAGSPGWSYGNCTSVGAPTATTLSASCSIFLNGTNETGMWAYGTVQCAEYWVVVPLFWCPTCNKVGEPINPGVGNVYKSESDVKFAGAGAIAYWRFYDSDDANGIDGVPGWRHSYDGSITTVPQPPVATYITNGPPTQSPLYATQAEACTQGFASVQATVPAWAGATAALNDGVCVVSNASGTIATLQMFSTQIQAPPASPIEYDVTREDGQLLRYTMQNGVINNPPGVSMRLAVTGSGFTVTDDDDNVEVYNAQGVLQSITSRAGVVQTLSYTSGVWSGVTDSFGNSLTVARNSQGSIASITLNGGGVVQYTYTSNRLQTVTNLDTTTTSYVYGDSSFPNALTSEVDESGTTFSTWGYDSQGRGTSTQEYGGANAQTLVYNSNWSVTVTDALGAARTFSYTRIGDRNAVNAISGSQCPTCQEMASTTYDASGWISSRADYNGNLTCYANDPTRGLELVRVEGFASGSTCPANLSTYTPQSGTLQRKITTVWNSTWREPSTITEPNRTTSFSYDGYGNVLTKTVTDTSVTPNVSRTWTYKYFNSGLYGQVQTATGPRTDITTDVTNYTYYNCTTGSDCGQVDTVTNGLSQVTTFNTYNAYGQPLTITDPNGVVMTLTYDARERLTSREVGTTTTSLSYWPIGLVKLVTLPDASTVQFTYDTAHRLTTSTDGAGNYIKYTLDALGNHTADNAYDPTGTLHRTHTRVFNTLSELYQDVNAAGTSAVTTTYGYDANANQTSIDAPLGRNTIPAYDALNRLDQITDPNSGITKIGYDANDNVASVLDPRSFTTAYTHDGFNEVTKLVSPDTGTSSSTYDSAGNLKTTTDGRSALGTYTYDALNRMTQLAYADQTINFTYDSGTYGIGRLTGASDANHTMAWTYNAQGRITGKSQTVAAVTKSVGYGYTNDDLTSIVTPSGQTVVYAYTNHQITSITINGTTLLSAVTYDPFGPATAWTWGNSSTVSRTYTEDGNPNVITTDGTANTYTVDNASRITAIADSGLSSNTLTFGYDLLDRLKSGTSSALNHGYTYDANGNRLTETGTLAYTENIRTTDNQITSTSGGLVRTYGYDNAGDTTSYTGATFTFNDRGRLSTAVTSGGTTTYLYNALGQLIEKSGNGGTTLLVYDEAGHLLGEYSSTGALIEETIWMADLPVATLRPNGSSISIYYVHADHLGTPRKITNPSGNTVVWRWDPDTFGTAAPSIATISYNLRFPGQYYMAETGLMYNYFRDYDPQTGRYIESDPIGLESGINTYAYVEDNPLWFGDRSGLTIADIILQLFPQQWSSDRCAQIAQKIANLNKDLDDRYELIRTNPGQLPQYGPGPNYTTVQGHYRVINKLDRDRRNLENDYDRHCRNGGCPPASPAADPTSNPAATAGSASTFFFVIGGILIFL